MLEIWAVFTTFEIHTASMKQLLMTQIKFEVTLIR